MKNFSNYNDYSTKDELHFESKVVHGALGTEPLTGAVSMPIFQAVTYRHPELGHTTGFAYSNLRGGYQRICFFQWTGSKYGSIFPVESGRACHFIR